MAGAARERVSTPCFCCRLEACECGAEACWTCGACPEHCQCEEGFLQCECEFSGDQADARHCRVHGWK